MPFWKFHDDWAEKMEIKRKISLFVNVHEDKIWYFEALQKGNKPPDLRTRLDFMRGKGPDYVKAWILHLVLDEITDSPAGYLEDGVVIFSLKEAERVVKQVERKVSTCREMNFVKKFVLSHLREILDGYRQARAGYQKIQVVDNFYWTPYMANSRNLPLD